MNIIDNGRRRMIGAAAATAALSSLAPLRAIGATWPDHPVRVLMGFPPGQTSDVIARAYCAALQPILGGTLFVDNKAGANGIIAAQAAKAAEPDGYTLLFGTSGQLVINPALYANMAYSTVDDFVPVASVARGRLFLVVNNDLPVKSLKDLLAYAKAHPGKLSFGSGGIGITSHLAMEMLRTRTGLDAMHVPYKGSPAALNGLISGDVQLMFDAGGALLPLVESGKIRAIAVSTLDRYQKLPQLPTVAEQGEPGFEVYAWNAVLAPKGTSPDLVQKLAVAFAKASHDPIVTQTLQSVAHDTLDIPLAKLPDFLRTEIRRWGETATAAGIKPGDMS